MKKILAPFLFLPSLICAHDAAVDLDLRGGIQQSFSLDGRYALYEKNSHLLFINAKGGIGTTTHTYTPHTHSPFLEGNIGLGYRTNSFHKNTFGIYSYFGKLKTPYHNNFSRATIGIEYFIKNFKTFLNFYTPIGNKSEKINKHYGFNKFRFDFQGHNLRFQNSGKYEVMSTVGTELGLEKQFKQIKAKLHGYLYSSTKLSNLRSGGNIDLSYSFAKRFHISARAGYDSFYKAQAQLGISYTFGNPNSSESYTKQHLKPVYLEEFFWVQRGTKVFSDHIVKSDLYFVDSSRVYSGGFLGDGTFETPFLNASLANTAISTVPNATVYFYQGTGNYQNFGTFNLFGSQSITGQGGNYIVKNTVVLPGSSATRPILARTALQQALNTPLITVTTGGSNLIENIGLTNASGAIATGGTLIKNLGNSIDSLNLHNLTATDKVSLLFLSGSQTVTLTENDIYGVDIKTFNSATLELQVTDNTFRTNTMIAQRFFQPIGASLFLESLNSSTFIVSAIKDNVCFNTTLNGNAHLGFGYLSSGTSINVTPNGFLANSSFGALPAASAGAFLFQGVDLSRVNINGCFDNFSATDEFTLQLCDINIKKFGFPATVAGMSQANQNTLVLPFASVIIINNP